MTQDDESPSPARHPARRRRRIPGPTGQLSIIDVGEVGAESGRLPVLFVHGLGGRGEQWLSQLDALAPSRAAAAVTLRGHADSGIETGAPLDTSSLARDVLTTADALGYERFVLVGHSLGALVAIAAGREAPQRVAGLFLVDPNGDLTRMPDDQVRSYLETLRRDPKEEMAFQFRHILTESRPEVAELILDDLATVEGEVLMGTLEGASRFPAAEALAAFEGPKACLITPLNSLPVSLHNLVGGLRVERILGTGHWPMLDRPGEVNAVLQSFLAAVDS